MIVGRHVQAEVSARHAAVAVRRTVLEALSVFALQLDAAGADRAKVIIGGRAGIDVAIAAGKKVQLLVQAGRVLEGSTRCRIGRYTGGADVGRGAVWFALLVDWIDGEMRG